MSITVTIVEPGAYPQFRKPQDHCFIAMPDEERLDEIINICACILADCTRESASAEKNAPDDSKVA